MRKAYTQPEAEILSISALEEFLIGSPEESIGNASVGDGLLNDNYANEWETE